MSYDTRHARGKGEGAGAPCQAVSLLLQPWRAANPCRVLSPWSLVQMFVKFGIIMISNTILQNIKLHASHDGSNTITESGVSNPARSLPEMTLYLPFPHFALRSANATTSYT
jgi:hypothetical protein